MKIAELRQEDEEKYNKISSDCGSLFNTIEWSNVFSGRVNRYGIYTDNDRLMGGFYLYNDRKYSLNFFRDPLYTPNIGPFLKVDAQNPTTIMNTWKEALTLMADFLDSIDYSIISCSLNMNVIDMQPFIWKKFKVIPGYTYLLDLSQSVDELWQRLSKVRKNEMKKAESDGLIVKQTDDYECIRELVLKTFSRQNRDIERHYLNKILFEFANKDNSYAYVVYKSSLPIAGTLCVYKNHTAHALMGGYDNNHTHRGATASVDWACIKHAHGMGIKCFDLEGSMNQNIERYFRGFGGQLTPYYRINKAKLPIEILMKFFRRDLF